MKRPSGTCALLPNVAAKMRSVKVSNFMFKRLNENRMRGSESWESKRTYVRSIARHGVGLGLHGYDVDGV